MNPLKVTFHTDGAGAVFYPNENHHLDGLLSWAWRLKNGLSVGCQPEDIPIDCDLPLEKRGYDDEWYWAASVLIPIEQVESIQWAKRKFNEERLHYQNEPNVSLIFGPTKCTNRPWPIIVSKTIVAYCVGDYDRVLELSSMIRAVGAERGRGRGQVVRVEIDEMKQDWSCERDDLAMRYIPHTLGFTHVRPRPPYWHLLNRAYCLSPGEDIWLK